MALHHLAAGEKVHLPIIAPPGDKGTAALVKTDAFEAIQLELARGETIAPHSVEGYVIVHCLEGAVTLEMGRPVELGPGDWVYLDRGETHGVSAQDDSLLLVTILLAGKA